MVVLDKALVIYFWFSERKVPRLYTTKWRPLLAASDNKISALSIHHLISLFIY